MAIAKQKKTMITAAMAAGVLIAGGTTVIAEKSAEPVARPAPQVSVASPNVALMATPNTLFEAVASVLPAGGGSAAGGAPVGLPASGTGTGGSSAGGGSTGGSSGSVSLFAVPAVLPASS